MRMSEFSLLRVDTEIAKLQKRVNDHDKMSGHEYAQESLLVIEALQKSLHKAFERIEKLEQNNGRDLLGKSGM
jgi:hypothetical protein